MYGTTSREMEPGGATHKYWIFNEVDLRHQRPDLSRSREGSAAFKRLHGHYRFAVPEPPRWVNIGEQVDTYAIPPGHCQHSIPTYGNDVCSTTG